MFASNTNAHEAYIITKNYKICISFGEIANSRFITLYFDWFFDDFVVFTDKNVFCKAEICFHC